MVKNLLCLVSASLFSMVYAAAPMSSAPHIGLQFQIVQNDFLLDNSNVKSAKMITNPDGGYVGLEVQLKPFAVEELQRLMNDGMGRMLNIILNNRIVASARVQNSLGQKFLIVSITREDALTFVNQLRANSHPQTNKIPIVQ